jgi:hypothetical protein
MFLQQARIALEKEDFDGFYEAFTGSIEILQIAPDDFIDDVKEIRVYAKKLHSAIQSSLNDNSNQVTAMSQSM